MLKEMGSYAFKKDSYWFSWFEQLQADVKIVFPGSSDLFLNFY